MTGRLRAFALLLVFAMCGFGQAASAPRFLIGAVSVARLRHKTPAKAWAALERALKLSDRQQLREGAAELKRAISLDPEFPEAYNNLGVDYMMLNRSEDAAAEFRRAIELDPAVSAYHCNLAAALTVMGQLDEGEAEAWTAVSLDAASPKARLMLGLLLARRPETRRDAEQNLAIAARQMPLARRALEDVHREGGAPGRGEP